MCRDIESKEIKNVIMFVMKGYLEKGGEVNRVLEY